MGAITIKEAIWRVGNKTGDNKPQYTRWSEIEVLQALDDGQKALAKYLPRVGGRTDIVRLRPGTRQSLALIKADAIRMLDGSTPVDQAGIQLVDIVRNMGDDGETPGRPVRIVSREALNGYDWHNSQGTAVKEFTYDPQTPLDFYVRPAIASTQEVWVELAWNTVPASLGPGGAPGSERYRFEGTNRETISIGDLYIDELVNYAASRLLMKDAKHAQNMARAQMHAQMFLGSLNAMVAAITGHNPNLKSLPFAPEPEAAAS